MTTHSPAVVMDGWTDQGDGCERHHDISEKEVLWLNV